MESLVRPFVKPNIFRVLSCRRPPYRARSARSNNIHLRSGAVIRTRHFEPPPLPFLLFPFERPSRFYRVVCFISPRFVGRGANLGRDDTAQVSRLSLLKSTLGANPFPKVSNQCCRVLGRPDAVMSVVSGASVPVFFFGFKNVRSARNSKALNQPMNPIAEQSDFQEERCGKGKAGGRAGRAKRKWRRGKEQDTSSQKKLLLRSSSCCRKTHVVCPVSALCPSARLFTLEPDNGLCAHMDVTSCDVTSATTQSSSVRVCTSAV